MTDMGCADGGTSIDMVRQAVGLAEPQTAEYSSAIS
jgi:hypothetical protein